MCVCVCVYMLDYNVKCTVFHTESCNKKCLRTSLVAQWLGIHLLMQRTGVRALVQEDPTCHRATKPVHHNY